MDSSNACQFLRFHLPAKRRLNSFVLLLLSQLYFLLSSLHTNLPFLVILFVNNGHNAGTTAKKVTLMWTCVAKGG